MANAYSLMNNFDEKLFSPDINLINQVLQTKQSKLDINRARVEKALSEVGNLDLIRDVDKEYAAERLNQVTNIVNRYANQDLSSNALTQSLIRDTNQVLDSNVENALISTKLYRNDRARWGEFQKKNPDKYLERNQAYSMQMAGANDWLASNNLTDSYKGGAKVIENFDYTAELNEQLPKVFKDLKIKSVIDPQGFNKFQLEDGSEVSAYTVMQKIQSLPKDVIRKAAIGQLSNRAYQQMQIDAWDRFGRGQDIENTRIAYNNFIDNKRDNLQSSIKSIESYINSKNLTSGQKEQYNRVLGTYKNQLNTLNNTQSNLDSLPYSKMSFDMYQEDFLRKMEEAYYIEPTVIDQELKENKLQVKLFQHSLDKDLESFKSSLKIEEKIAQEKIDKGVNALGELKETNIGAGGFRYREQKGESFAGDTDDKNYSEIGKFDNRFEEAFNEAVSTGVNLGEINSENVNLIASYTGGETFNGKQITSNEQRVALLRASDLASEKLFEIESLNRELEEGSKIFLDALVKSDDYNFEAAIDYNFHIEVGGNGAINYVNGNGRDGEYSWERLYSKMKNGEELTDSEQNTVNIKHKLSYINGAFRDGNLTSSQANMLLSKLGESDDLEMFIPESIEEMNKSFLRETAVPLDANSITQFMTSSEKGVYDNKVVPYLTALGVNNIKVSDFSSLRKLTSKMESEKLTVIPDSYKKEFRKQVRSNRIISPGGSDAYYDRVVAGDLEQNIEGEFFDRGTLVEEGTEIGFSDFVDKRMSVLNQDLQKKLKPLTLDSFQNRLVVEGTEVSKIENLPLIFEKAGVYNEFSRNIKPVKNTPVQFVRQSNGDYAIVGSFEYKSQNIFDKNAPSVQVGFGLTEDEGDNKFFTLSKEDYERYLIGSKLVEDRYNPYSIAQKGEAAKVFKHAPGLGKKGNLGNFTVDGLLLDSIRANYEVLVNSDSRIKDVNLEMPNVDQLKNALSRLNVEYEYIPKNDSYYEVLKVNGQEFSYNYGKERENLYKPLGVQELTPERRALIAEQAKANLGNTLAKVLLQNELDAYIAIQNQK